MLHKKTPEHLFRINFRIAQRRSGFNTLGADEIIIGKNDPFPYAGSCWKDIEIFLKVALALEACFACMEIGLDD